MAISGPRATRWASPKGSQHFRVGSPFIASLQGLVVGLFSGRLGPARTRVAVTAPGRGDQWASRMAASGGKVMCAHAGASFEISAAVL